MQLGASGFLFNVLTDGAFGINVGMWMLSAVVLIYVAAGGLRAVAYVDTLQCILLALGIVITGFIALNIAGGWGALNEGLAKLAASPVGKWGTTKGYGGGDYNAYFAIPGVIQFTAGLGKQTPVGGLWTGVMCLTYMFALMGIQSSPAFSMWAFSNNNPRPFAPQQVWASSAGIGFILFFFTAFQGMGAHLLGANPAVTKAGLAISDVLAASIAKKPDSLVPYYFNYIATAAPWLVGLLAVCALAAMQSTGAAYMSTAGGMLTRDLYKRYLNPGASHETQKIAGRIGVLIIVVSALLVATFSRDALVLLGGLAVAFGFQMWPPLVAVCWYPKITRQGATWGLAAGLLGVIFTENFGLTILKGIGIDIWGRWPWTIHSAGWGILLNVAVCWIVSANTQDRGVDGPPAEVPRLPGRARFALAGKTGSRPRGMGHYAGLDVLRHRSGRRHRQLDLRRSRRGAGRMDVRHALYLGLADTLLGPWRGYDVDARLQDGNVHGAGYGYRGARGGHRRRGSAAGGIVLDETVM